MKIQIDFENGMQISVKPENIQLLDNDGKNSVVVTKTDQQAIVPLLFFSALLATPAELQARKDAAEALVQATKALAD